MPRGEEMQHTLRNALRAVWIAIALTLAPAASGAAESYPTKPERIVVPFAPGGPKDLISRVIGQKLTETWGYPVIVDNRAGAGGNIGTQLVAKAPADGYTLMLHSTAFVVNPSLYSAADYDALRDFAPVTLAAVSPVIIVAHPSFSANNIQELIQLARQKAINYASPGTGTTGHLGGELLNTLAGRRCSTCRTKARDPR